MKLLGMLLALQIMDAPSQLIIVIGPPNPIVVLHVGAGQTYATIQACENAASVNVVCEIHAGTYTENVTINGVGRRTFRNHFGESPVLVGTIFVGSTAPDTRIDCNVGGGQWSITGYGTAQVGITGGIQIQSGDGVTVTGCLIHTAYGTGFYARNSTRTVFTGGEIYGMLDPASGATGSGISINSSHSTDNTFENGTTISNSHIHDNAVDGIALHGEYMTVVDCLIADNITSDWLATHPDGIALIKSLVDGYQEARHVRIIKNMIRNHTQNIYIHGSANDAGTGSFCEDIWAVSNAIYSDSGVVNGVNMDATNTAGIVVAGCKNVRVYHNTIGRHNGAAFRSANSGGGFENTDGSLYAKNNIFANSLLYGFHVHQAADYAPGSLDHNQYFNATNAGTWIATVYATRALFTATVTTQEVNGQDGNPLIDAFPTPTLQALSPAIDEGVDLTVECGALCATDKAGVTRPIGSPWDIGAYQRVP